MITWEAVLGEVRLQMVAVVEIPIMQVVAVVQLHPGRNVATADLIAFVKARIGSVKAPKQVEIWPDLPRSKVGKVMKKDIRATILARASIHNP